jgi:hypothetical protein
MRCNVRFEIFRIVAASAKVKSLMAESGFFIIPVLLDPFEMSKLYARVFVKDKILNLTRFR